MRASPIKQSLQKSLTILALVLSQWLTFAHGFQHPAFGAGDQVCQFCIHGQGLDTGGTPSAPVAPVAHAAIEVPAPVRAGRVGRRDDSLPPIRGPPQLVA